LTRNKACLANMVRLAQKFGKHQAFMGHTKLTNPTRSPPKRDASPRVIHVDRPCPISGHVGHSMHECRTLLKHVEERSSSRVEHRPSTCAYVTAAGSDLHRQVAELSAQLQSVLHTQRMALPPPPPRHTGHVPPHSYHQPPMPYTYATPVQQYHAHATSTGATMARPDERSMARDRPTTRLGSRFPRCGECGRIHNPAAICFGKNYGRYETSVRPEQHGNAQSHATTFASNEDLQWPSVHTLMTSLPSTYVAAAAPVPYDAPGMNMSNPARAHSTPTQAGI